MLRFLSSRFAFRRSRTLLALCVLVSSVSLLFGQASDSSAPTGRVVLVLPFENRSGQPKRFLIRRRECEPSAIREISDESGPIAWHSLNGQINFEIELTAGESKMVAIRFHELPGDGCNGDSLPYRFKTMLRRYLCEARDNYITTTKSWLADFVSR